jgi:hypothetical protein
LVVFNILVVTNLIVQAFRVRKSRVSIYYRLVAVNLFIILFVNQVIFPVFSASIFHYDRLGLTEAPHIVTIVDLALLTFFPVTVILMVQRLKSLTLYPVNKSTFASP